MDWSAEEPCFQNIGEEIADFYRIQPGHYLEGQTKDTSDSDGNLLSYRRSC